MWLSRLMCAKTLLRISQYIFGLCIICLVAAHGAVPRPRKAEYIRLAQLLKWSFGRKAGGEGHYGIF